MVEGVAVTFSSPILKIEDVNTPDAPIEGKVVAFVVVTLLASLNNPNVGISLVVA